MGAEMKGETGGAGGGREFFKKSTDTKKMANTRVKYWARKLRRERWDRVGGGGEETGEQGPYAMLTEGRRNHAHSIH